MLGKYKGFYVPRKDPNRNIGGVPAGEKDTLKNRFCFKARGVDCLSCGTCLFCEHSSTREDNNTAFIEWCKAKGKVEYDRD